MTMENIYAVAARTVRELRNRGVSREDASNKVKTAMNSSEDYQSVVKALKAL